MISVIADRVTASPDLSLRRRSSPDTCLARRAGKHRFLSVQGHKRVIFFQTVTAKIVIRFLSSELRSESVRYTSGRLELVTLVAGTPHSPLSFLRKLLLQFSNSTQQHHLLLAGTKHPLLKIHQLAAKLKYCRPNFLAIPQFQDRFSHLAGRLRTGQRAAQHIQHRATPSHVIWHREPTTGGLAT